MINTLLFIHCAIAVFLVVVILMQRTGEDGVSSMASSGNNMGLVSAKTSSSLFIRLTVILGFLFFLNSLIIGNLLSKQQISQENKITKQLKEKSDKTKILEEISQDSPVAN